MPLFSIITVVFNAEAVLEDTIKSLVEQTSNDYEYIIVDGLSTDGTPGIIKKYNGHITKLISEKDNGIYDAMNKGLRFAEGKWVYFLNAGDKFANKNVLQNIKENYLDNDNVIVCGKVRVVDNIKNIIFNKYYPSFNVTGNNFRKMFASAFCHQALFISKKAYNIAGGFNVQFKIFADFNAVIKILSAGFTVRYIDELIGFYDINGGSADWKKAKKIYYEKEAILSSAGQNRKFPVNILGLLKLKFFILRKKITHARFR